MICTNLLGLLLAMIMTKPLFTRNISRALFFTTNLVGGLLLGFIWKFVFAEPFPSLGESLGIPDVIFNWLLQPGFAVAALVLVNTWKTAGYIMIIYISGLQNIPTDVLEAADMDGQQAGLVSPYYITLINAGCYYNNIYNISKLF